MDTLPFLCAVNGTLGLGFAKESPENLFIGHKTVHQTY